VKAGMAAPPYSESIDFVNHHKGECEMRILVTGGNGFIGSSVVKSLVDAGHDVKILDSKGEADYTVDIRNPSDVSAALGDARPSAVFHLAAVSDARYALNHPVEATEINVKGTAAVFDAARRLGVRRVLLASTCWVANAMGSGILDESSPFLPTGAGHVYTTTKIACEILAHDFHKLYGLNFTILRYGIPYGPGIWPGLVLRNWLERARANESIVIYGDGSASRRFIYIDDLAEAHSLALQDVADNQTYNLEGMRAVTIKELAETFRRAWGPIEIEYRPEPTRIGEFQYLRKVISKRQGLHRIGMGAENRPGKRRKTHGRVVS
jgi:nucleoside-diphosphate-sugar epimerase